MFQITPEQLPYLYFSQFGEDLIINNYFGGKPNGFFVDIGAHHPFHYSNSFALYLRGWTGINVEPDPRPIALFKQIRERDTTLNIGIAKGRGKLPYYQFKSGEINTFNREQAERLDRDLRFDTRIIATTDVATLPLREVLKKYAADQPIDFLSVDTESLDLEVIESSDWEKFRPRLVLVEDLHFDCERLQDSAIYGFMKSQGYRLMAKTLATLIFEEGSVYEERTAASVL
jgi:FkbM family methyltransferase